MSLETHIQSIRESCSLPDGWRVRHAGINIEVIADENGPPAEAVIEVIVGEGVTEIVLAHQGMPGRGELIRAAETGDQPEPVTYSDVPSTLGVLRFDEPLSGTVFDAIEQLADLEQMGHLAEARDPFTGNDSMSVIDAVEANTDVPLDAVDGTLTSI